MGKLIIYHDNAPEKEVELGEATIRIGRADGNEIVLADPTQGVSRLHAELRFAQGQYSLFDMKSQNGIWVEGKRVPSVVLEPGVPVVVGAYKLVLKAEQPPALVPGDETVLLSPADLMDGATIMVPKGTVDPSAAPVRAQAPVSRPVEAPKVEAPKVAPPPPPAPEPPIPAPAPPVAPPVAPPAQAKPAARSVSRPLVGVTLAIVAVLGVAAVLLVRTSLRSRTSDRGPTGPAPAVPAATPLRAAPASTDSAAQAVAQPTPPAPEAAPVASPTSSEVAAPVALARAPVRPPAPAAAIRRPGSARGVPTEAKRRPRTPVARAAPAAPPAKKLDPDTVFEEARSAMIKGDYLAAIAGFQSVLEVNANYPTAANLLNVARGGARNASQLAVDSGNKAEMSGDYAGAMKEYDRALQLDPPSTPAADAKRRLKLRMQREGEDAFAQARTNDAAGKKQEAIAAYEKALQLLPAGHPDAKAASDRLAALKGTASG